MKTLITILCALVLISCSRKTVASRSTTDTSSDSVNVRDSVRITDSVRIIRRDSVVLVDGTSTGVELQPCDSIRPFIYHYEQNRVKVTVQGRQGGHISVQVDTRAAIAYWRSVQSEQTSSSRANYKHYNVISRRTITERYQVRTIVVKWPWWLYALAIVAGAIVAAKLVGWVRPLINYHKA